MSHHQVSRTQASSREPHVLVIGAGVAGTVCALHLRQLGLAVTLAEKETFPRNKVCGCCIGGVGLKSLDRVGQRDWVVEHGVTTRRWKASIGNRTVELSLPDGVAISRALLDSGLLEAARRAGAHIRQPCRAAIDELTDSQVVVTLGDDDRTTTEPFDVVVMAGGLNAAGLNRWLPWQVSPHGPFGASFHADLTEIDPGIIYMACDDDGYVGLVQLENGQVDVAAALHSGSRSAVAGTPRQRIDAILQRSRFGDLVAGSESRLMTTPPLRRSRQAGRGRLLVIGDAAGYVEPFTGEGMTWAAQSAIAAAELIASDPGGADIGQRWSRQSKALLRRKKLACRTITRVLRSPMARRVAGWGLSHWPSLAEPLIRDLNQ